MGECVAIAESSTLYLPTSLFNYTNSRFAIQFLTSFVTADYNLIEMLYNFLRKQLATADRNEICNMLEICGWCPANAKC